MTELGLITVILISMLIGATIASLIIERPAPTIIKFEQCPSDDDESQFGSKTG